MRADAARLFRGAAVVALVWAAAAAARADGNDGPGPRAHIETAGLPPATAAIEEKAALPRPLSEADAARYGRIFALQKKGRWRAADREIRRLGDRLLLGHVLAQRYLHPTKYRSHYHELARWLARYADHPDAPRIWRLALKRKPRRARRPRAPVRRAGGVYGEAVESEIDSYRSPRKRSAGERRRVARIQARIRRLVRRNHLTVAEKTLARSEVRRALDPVERDLARARIAAGWFYYGNDRKALALAGAAAARSGRQLPYAHWTAGLAAYRLGAYDRAAAHFEAMVAVPRVRGWNRAAAAFWAGRANLVARRPERVSHWLGIAADQPRTFYGILARRVLGLDSPLRWDRAILKRRHVEALLGDAGARRALALIQVGQMWRAERELGALAGADDPDLRTALLAVAEAAGLPSLAMRTAAAAAAAGEMQFDRGFYPVPRWRPREGFIVDRALVYAFMRQESGFKVRAKSPAGARGLMQLMPATAGFLARKRFRGRGRNKLFDPQLNIALGQKYLDYLIRDQQIGGDVFLLAAAYNGGPGNLAKWQRRVKRRTTDPLMFIESIPARETRLFIERVLANLWIYRERLGQPAPSLDAIAAGERPVYQALDGSRVATAGDGGN